MTDELDAFTGLAPPTGAPSAESVAAARARLMAAIADEQSRPTEDVTDLGAQRLQRLKRLRRPLTVLVAAAVASVVFIGVNPGGPGEMPLQLRPDAAAAAVLETAGKLSAARGPIGQGTIRYERTYETSPDHPPVYVDYWFNPNATGRYRVGAGRCAATGPSLAFTTAQLSALSSDPRVLKGQIDDLAHASGDTMPGHPVDAYSRYQVVQFALPDPSLSGAVRQALYDVLAEISGPIHAHNQGLHNDPVGRPSIRIRMTFPAPGGDDFLYLDPNTGQLNAIVEPPKGYFTGRENVYLSVQMVTASPCAH